VFLGIIGIFSDGENSAVATYMQFTTFPERPAHPRIFPDRLEQG